MWGCISGRLRGIGRLYQAHKVSLYKSSGGAVRHHTTQQIELEIVMCPYRAGFQVIGQVLRVVGMAVGINAVTPLQVT